MAGHSPAASEQSYHVRAVQRAIGLLKAFDYNCPEMSLTQLSQRTGLSLPTANRLLATLQREALVESSAETGRYRLGVACLHLGSIFLARAELRTVALPVLEKLRQETRETVHLGILDQMEVVYLEKLEGLWPIALMGSRVGGRNPAYCTGVGKVMLSYEDPEKARSHFARTGLQRYTPNTITDLAALLEELQCTKHRGYALDAEEHEMEVRCVAAPIRDHRGTVVAALSISGPAVRMTALIDRNRGIERVQEAAVEVSRRLGYVDSAAAMNERQL